MSPHDIDYKLNPVSLRDEVYHLLRERILSHQYPPNFRFDLSALEERLGISRTPLKEALQRLESEGLVEIRPRRGTFVTRLDPQEVAESFEIRRILECAVALEIVKSISDEEISQLILVNEKMMSLLKRDEYQSILLEYLELDREFHRIFVQCHHNSKLIKIHAQINTHLHVARVRAKFHLSDSLLGTQNEHAAILDALSNRDGEALYQAVDSHLKLASLRTLEALQDE